VHTVSEYTTMQSATFYKIYYFGSNVKDILQSAR